MPSEGDSWCILRTSGRSTLPLASSLTNAGFEVWTPVQTRMKRLPRARAKIDRPAPIMPTFVFAKARHLIDLIGLSNRREGHEGFSIFHHFGRIPLVEDVELEALRSEERRVVPKHSRHVFSAGQRVRVPAGAFCGMVGSVENGNERFTMVCFGGGATVKIATFLLRSDLVENAPIAA